MAWVHGYLALWVLCGGIVLRDLIPLVPFISVSHPSMQVWRVFITYIAALAFLGKALPGKAEDGVPLADGTVLKYKCNGLLVTVVTVIALATATWRGYIPGSWVADNYAELFVAANLFAFWLASYLFVNGRLTRPRNWLKQRSFFEDFVMGTQLNPFVLGVNIKFFSYRPAMAGWLIVNLSFLNKQYEELGAVTGRMLLYQLATGWYICDYFMNERKIVSTWDIIAERFGLMLIYGDYVFIIFGFSVQNFFLLRDTTPLTPAQLASTVSLFCVGFYIFRGANSQKHQFKRQPKSRIWGSEPKTIGGQLLISGFWGVARHMNYTGDLLVAMSFCLPCGFKSSLAYLYFIYLLLLIVHREKRDEERCVKRYGPLWDVYRSQVPYRMIPHVY